MKDIANFRMNAKNLKDYALSIKNLRLSEFSFYMGEFIKSSLNIKNKWKKWFKNMKFILKLRKNKNMMLKQNTIGQ